MKEIKERASRSGPIRTFADLLVDQQARKLMLEVSQLTKTFPRQEQWEMGRQLRASSRSVGANIVEGWAKRNSAPEFKRHLMIAYGECAETQFWVELAREENCAPAEKCDLLRGEYSKLGMLIYKLWKGWRKLG